MNRAEQTCARQQRRLQTCQRLTPWLALWLGAVSTICSFAGATQGTRSAGRGDLALTVTLVTAGGAPRRDGAITACEPLLARVELANRARASVKIEDCPALTVRLEISDGRGKLVAATARPGKVSPEVRCPVLRLGPGESRMSWLVVSGLYQFRKPGAYMIRVQQLGLSRGFPVLAEASARLRVLPFDIARLDARCRELAGQSVPMDRRNYGGAEIGVRTKALLSVRHDVVLPYLEWMAREWGDPYPIRAMRRIGTQRARNLVKALAARKDRVGEAARQALHMSLETTFWDIEG